jgi:hypothetical protein
VELPKEYNVSEFDLFLALGMLDFAIAARAIEDASPSRGRGTAGG